MMTDDEIKAALDRIDPAKIASAIVAGLLTVSLSLSELARRAAEEEIKKAKRVVEAK